MYNVGVSLVDLLFVWYQFGVYVIMPQFCGGNQKNRHHFIGEIVNGEMH